MSSSKLTIYYYFHFSSVSLPRLVNFDWRVDVKTSSDSAARMAQPTCIVQMKVSLLNIIIKYLREKSCRNP